jgi:hypothetical protein
MNIQNLDSQRNSASEKDRKKPCVIEIFKARCEARGVLYAAGEIDLHAAVDVLQEHAIKNGVVAALGQDAVQRLMADALEMVLGGYHS